MPTVAKYSDSMPTYTVDQSIEDIILAEDRRGIARLRAYLPDDFCVQAAKYILEQSGDVLIATGFYTLSAGKSETDGPPGAIAIGNALQSLGRRVAYISDHHTTSLLRDLVGDNVEVIDFPICNAATSQQASENILSQQKPGLIISIERCGRNIDGIYRNMWDDDITAHTARLDYMFESSVPSVGIGDGGNEIGMGNLAKVIPGLELLSGKPAVTTVNHKVIASVSNWGGYGLVAALSQLTGRNLMPTPEAEARLIHRMVELGAVDGVSGKNKACVDGFTLEENTEVLRRLNERLIA